MRRGRVYCLRAWFGLCLSFVCASGSAALPEDLACVREATTGPVSAAELDEAQLERFITTAFYLDQIPRNAKVLLLTDLPQTTADLHGNWQDRLALVHRWAHMLKKIFHSGDVNLVYYPSTGGHNRPLPKKGWVLDNFEYPAIFSVEEAEAHSALRSDHSLAQTVVADWFQSANLVLSLPRYSATAPISEISVENAWPFKALSIPGFNSGLLPIFGSDYKQIASRIAKLRPLLDEATSAEISFEIKGAALSQQNVQPSYKISFDLKGRISRAEPTIQPAWPYPGERALDNAPIGEVWIVPNESGSSLQKGIFRYKKETNLSFTR
ncbi:MAG: hypothetical protein R3B54_18375 [Bdellovibrionota bacterium]